MNVPGRSPYAVYVPRFKCRVDLLEPLWMPLPALVSAGGSTGDPAAVEILWDDVPGHDAQLMDRIAGSRSALHARPARVDAFAARSLPDPSQMQQLAADSARQALQYVRDPAMRKLLRSVPRRRDRRRRGRLTSA